MKYFSMFSGAGGNEIGIERAYSDIKQSDEELGLSELKIQHRREWSVDERQVCVQSIDRMSSLCIGFSEIDKWASGVLRYKWPEVRNYGDATKINTDELPEFDMLVAGFPCQAFSIAGKRRGFEDTRGTLFYEVARVAEGKKPRYLLLENVKGLVNHEKGETFRIILETLRELGYHTQWGVVNSRYFGIPQNRERVFIVGSLRGEPIPKVFPICISDGEDTYEIKEMTNNRQGYRVYSTNGIMSCLNSNAGGVTKDIGITCSVLTPNRVNKRQNGRRIKNNGEPSFTLNCQDIHGIYDGIKIRRLTPVECERLMSWPDGHTSKAMIDGKVVDVSNTQRYKMCGNGVVSKCVEEMIRKMRDVL